MNKQILIILLLSTCYMHSQKIEIAYGSYENLKGIHEYTLVFDYADLDILDFDSEGEYVKEEMLKREEKGTSEEWKTNWYKDREYRYHPRYIKAFNEYFKKREINVGIDNVIANHTMKILQP